MRIRLIETRHRVDQSDILICICGGSTLRGLDRQISSGNRFEIDLNVQALMVVKQHVGVVVFVGSQKTKRFVYFVSKSWRKRAPLRSIRKWPLISRLNMHP